MKVCGGGTRILSSWNYDEHAQLHACERHEVGQHDQVRVVLRLVLAGVVGVRHHARAEGPGEVDYLWGMSAEAPMLKSIHVCFQFREIV